MMSGWRRVERSYTAAAGTVPEILSVREEPAMARPFRFGVPAPRDQVRGLADCGHSTLLTPGFLRSSRKAPWSTSTAPELLTRRFAPWPSERSARSSGSPESAATHAPAVARHDAGHRRTRRPARPNARRCRRGSVRRNLGATGSHRRRWQPAGDELAVAGGRATVRSSLTSSRHAGPNSTRRATSSPARLPGACESTTITVITTESRQRPPRRTRPRRPACRKLRAAGARQAARPKAGG